MMIDAEEIRHLYESRYPIFLSIAGKLENHISDQLYELDHIDSVRARAKSPDRFLQKALKSDENGNRKYSEPFNQIQDQIGARVTVFYLSDIPVIRNRIEKYFKHIELTDKSPESDSEFGYIGTHFILKIPDDVIPDDESIVVPEFFELQIKTLFQHAWSEAHHDLGYKSKRKLNALEIRKIAFTAAQAWGADTIFNELFEQIAANDNILSVEGDK